MWLTTPSVAIYSSLQLNTDIAFCVHRTGDVCVHSQTLKHIGVFVCTTIDFQSFCQNNNFFLSKSSPCPVPRGVQSESQRESQDPSGHFQPVQAVQRVLLHGICLNIFCLQLFACHPLRLIRPMLPIWAADVGLSDDCFSASVRLSGSNRADFVLKSGDFANWRQWLRKTAQRRRWSRRPQ